MAEERDGIAAEPPIDVDKQAANWHLDGTLVVLAAVRSSGSFASNPSSFGFGEIGIVLTDRQALVDSDASP